jgi:molecular chaperone GrpE
LTDQSASKSDESLPGETVEKTNCAIQEENAAEPETDAEPKRDLAADLAAKERQYEELATQYVRLRADFDNHRRRTRTELENMAERAAEKLVANLLPVLDNLDRALDATKMAADAGGLYAGVDMVRRGLIDTLAAEGLMEVPGVGADFDPNSHEAIDRSGDDATCVLEVYRKGYKLAGRVLRPAMVKVGPAPVVDAQQQ